MTKVIGHRAQDMHPSKYQYCDMLEVDVMMTADREIVLRHDHKVDGTPVWEMRSDALRAPLLDDLVVEVPLPLFVELKLPEKHWQAGFEDFEERVLQLLRPKDVVLSFSAACCAKIKQLDPDRPVVQTLKDRRLPHTEEQVARYADGVCCHVNDLAWNAGSHSLPLFLYGDFSYSSIEKGVYPGIAGVIVDNPEVFHALRRVPPAQ